MAEIGDQPGRPPDGRPLSPEGEPQREPDGRIGRRIRPEGIGRLMPQEPRSSGA